MPCDDFKCYELDLTIKDESKHSQGKRQNIAGVMSPNSIPA